MFKKILQSVREYKTDTILTMLYVFFEVVIDCIIPFIISKMVNEIKAGCGIKTILIYGGILIILALLSLLFGALAGKKCANASCGFAKNLRHDLFYKVQDFSFENIDHFSSASLVTRMTTDITNVQMAYMMIIRTAIRSPFMVIFSFAMAFVMGGPLAAIFVLTIPVMAVTFTIVLKKASPLFKSVFHKYDQLNESVEENVRGMRVVKSFVREEYEKKKFGKASKGIKNDFAHVEKIIALNAPIMQFCLYIQMLVVIYFGAYRILGTSSTMDVGQMSGLLTYGFQILMNLQMLSFIFVILSISNESLHRIEEVIDTNSTLTSPENGLTVVSDGSIDFNNVSFKYSQKAKKMALSNVDLHIKSGETIGIIGGTGSSKSTLIQLISRLYDTTEGSVYVGGHDVKEYDLNTLRNEVSVVLQKNILFSGTIKENLRWGNPNATDAELIEACKLAQADEFISSFPNGYDTIIEQGGSNVSGGQKQRLCIARALLKKPKILILDDSTSAVDTKTDAMIRKGFKTYIPETTKLIIAQRLTSVQDADRILILDGGSIVSIGSHEELLASSPIYKEIWNSQNSISSQEGGDK